MIAALAVAAVLTAIGLGLQAIGTPANSRLRRFDERRVEDLRAATEDITTYWTNHHSLPTALDSLGPSIAAATPLRDPADGTAYEYRVLGDSTYELCASFARASEASGRGALSDAWQHGPGHQCFRRHVSADST